MKAKLDFKTDRNLKELKVGLEKERKNLSKRIKDGMRKWIQNVLAQSKAEVPVDTGTLQQSTFIDETSEGYDFGYGGSQDTTNPKTGQLASDYMVEVHEDLNAYHPHGNAKFLENPLNRLLHKLEQYIGGSK